MSIKPKAYNDVEQFAVLVAKKQGWKLNPDTELVGMLIEGLKTNYNRYGYLSCPCRDADGNRDADKDIICPCDYCVPDQEEYGYCYCGLFLTENFFKTGKEPASIPERRNV